MSPPGPPPPAPAHIQAAAGWRAIDFISDLHLTESMPRTFEAWAAHMVHTDADAVVLLGDVFEVWVGDEARHRPFERRCLEVLASTARRPQWMMVGNRDFLVGAEMRAACGLAVLPDPALLDAWGRRVLLSHGDALCLDDVDYQRFRALVRSQAWQADFLARSLDERTELAARIRAESESRKRGGTPGAPGQASTGANWADVDPALAVGWLRAHGARELVHGHTHRPGSGPLASGFTRHVLSDWDLDADVPRAEVLRLTREGFSRMAPMSGASAAAVRVPA